MSKSRSSTTPATDDAATLEGLSQLKPGFCFSEVQDRDFALGWPHMARVQPVLLEDEDPIGSATRLLRSLELPPRMIWPRRTAMGLVRAWGQPVLFDLAPGVSELRENVHVALWNARQIDAAEAGALLRVRMCGPAAGLGDAVPELLVLLLEAFVGAEAVARAIVDTLEAMDAPMLLADWALPPRVTLALGHVLLRVPPSVAQSLRARMRRVLEPLVESGPLRELRLPRSGQSHAKAVHVLLHGAHAVDTCTDRSPPWLCFAGDDPNFVQMRVSLHRGPYFPDVRLAFVGGTEILPALDRLWPNLRTPVEQGAFLDQIAPVRHPHVVRTVLRMTGGSLVRARASEWLAEHRDYAAPLLQAQVDGRTALAGAARAALDKLEGGA